MINVLTNTTIDLDRSALLNIDARASLTVSCEAGLVWVTLEGERTDHWLLAGERLTLDRPGHVVIEAAQASRVALEERPVPAFRFRLPGLPRLPGFVRRAVQTLAA
jgi:hypothetical protein